MINDKHQIAAAPAAGAGAAATAAAPTAVTDAGAATAAGGPAPAAEVNRRSTGEKHCGSTFSFTVNGRQLPNTPEHIFFVNAV